MPDPILSPRVVTGFVQMAQELAADYAGLGAHLAGVLDGSIAIPPPLPDPGPNPAWLALVAAAQGSPVLLELVKLHEPHADYYPATIKWQCHGEQPNGSEWEYEEWPCETTAIIAQNLGVDVVTHE